MLVPRPTPTTPGGSTTEIQYNNAGAFAGSSLLTFNPATELAIAVKLNVDAENYDHRIHSIQPIRMGDLETAQGSTRLTVDDSSVSISLQCHQGVVKLGDPESINNGVYLGVDSGNTTAEFAGDFKVTNDTKGLVLKSPDATYWRVTIDNAGALSTATV